jgi:hypothetical protein
MYIDARYHIASLAAVLIAVGIGLLVGVALLGGEPLPEHTKKVYLSKISQLTSEISRLTSEFKAERREREKLGKELQVKARDAQAFGKELLPLLLAHQLQGRRVVVISLSDKADGLVDIRRAISEGGGEVAGVVSLAGLPRPLDEKTLAAMAGDFGLASPDGVAQEYSAADLMTMLTKALTLGVCRKGLEQEAARGWLDIDGPLPPISSATVIVVLGGNSVNGTDDPTESLFLKALVQRGRRIVGCERSDAAFSSMGNMRSVLTATVDNIDQTAGKISLVFCIKGMEGDFGVQDSAESLLPPRVPD